MRLLLSFLCAAAVSWSTSAVAEPGPHRVTVGHADISYKGFFSALPSSPWLEVGWAYELPRAKVKLPLEVGAGLRATLPSGAGVPLEGWARLKLVASVGPWRPTVGPEFGVSGATVLPDRADGLPDDITAREQSLLSPFFVSFEAAPLRFAFDRFTVSAFEVGLGTTLGPAGATQRISISYLRAEVSL